MCFAMYVVCTRSIYVDLNEAQDTESACHIGYTSLTLTIASILTLTTALILTLNLNPNPTPIPSYVQVPVIPRQHIFFFVTHAHSYLQSLPFIVCVSSKRLQLTINACRLNHFQGLHTFIITCTLSSLFVDCR